MGYQGVVALQATVVAACGLFVWYLSRMKTNNMTKTVLSTAHLCFLANAAYLMELMANSYEGSIVAMKIKYIGIVYWGTMLLNFAGKYCKKPIHTVVFSLLQLWNTAVLVCVWGFEYNDYIFKNPVYVTDGAFDHLRCQYGPMYIINMALLIFQMLWCMWMAISGWRNGHNRKFRMSCAILFVCSLAPSLVVPIHIMGGVGGYQILLPVTAFSVMGFFLSALLQDMFDISEVAKENIITNMDEPIVILDSNYGFVEANTHAEAMFPSLKDCEVGAKIQENALLAYVRTGMVDKLYQNNRVYDVHVDRIYDEDQAIGYSIKLTDLTYEYNQMRRIHALMTEAKKANQAKSDFLASMSHEIRTPINSIIGMNEMIMRETTNPTVKKYATDVKNAAAMLVSLVNDILDSSKIASGKLSIVPVKYVLKDMLTDLYNMTIMRAEEKNLQLKVEVDPKLPRMYVGDDIRIRQVLINLLTNGIKYSDTGTVTLRVSGIQEDDCATLRFSVKDTGHGIKKEHMERIFTRFDRGEEEKNRQVEGTGLGLSVSVQLLELMDSRMQIESEVGVGSDFYFDLVQPVADANPIGDFTEKDIQLPVEKKKDGALLAPKAKVLVVDDNEMNLRVFVNLLKKSQMQITKATSGKEAIDIIRRNAFDLIFLDHMMPEMDGVETLQRISTMKDNPCKNTPVIVLTANAVAGAREQYLEKGFSDFLAKPIFSDQLEAMVRKYLPDCLIEGATPEKELLQEEAIPHIPEIEEIDLEYAMAVWKDEEGLNNALLDFHDAIPGVEVLLQDGIEHLDEEEARKEYRLQIHTLKGTSAMIGALLISKLCRLIELAMNQQQMQRVLDLHQMLVEELQKQEERLQVIVPKKVLNNPQEVQDLCIMLEDALDRADYTTADFLIKQMDLYQLSEEKEKQMTVLKRCIAQLDDQGAKDILVSLK